MAPPRPARFRHVTVFRMSKLPIGGGLEGQFIDIRQVVKRREVLIQYHLNHLTALKPFGLALDLI